MKTTLYLETLSKVRQMSDDELLAACERIADMHVDEQIAYAKLADERQLTSEALKAYDESQKH